MQKALEHLTLDEEAILQRPLHEREQWEIKKKIRMNFIKRGDAPETELLFYKIGSLIGKGSFGKVNLGLHKLTRQMVAIKSISWARNRADSEANPKKDEPINEAREKGDVLPPRIQKEFEHMSALLHPNVVKIYERLEIATHCLFIMELCQGGNLLNYVRRRQRLTEQEARYFFEQVMVGIAYIHS